MAKPSQALRLMVVIINTKPEKKDIHIIGDLFFNNQVNKKMHIAADQIPSEFAWSKVPTGLKVKGVSPTTFP